MRVCPHCGSVYVGPLARCSFDHTPLVEQDDDVLVGRQLDRYHIEERLGIGGMGCVYRARHSVIDRAYAIKVLFGDYASNEKFQARFRREATSVSKIRHPNIVQVEDFGRSPAGLTFLAMELVRGQTLEALLAESSALSPARAALITRQVAEGLRAAHDLGFVHRDVKPSNIMLTTGSDFVKLLDFGAVSLRAVPTDERLTAVGHIIGTPTYMAPEQSQDPNVGPTADVYSLGIILFEMLTGQPPFSSRTRAGIIVQHITEPVPPLPPSQGLEALTMWMLQKLPEYRPPSMAEVVAELDRLGFANEAHPGPAAGSGEPTLPPGYAGFYAAPTTQVLLEDERDKLKELYAILDRDNRGDPTDDDARPTPPEHTNPARPSAPSTSLGDRFPVLATMSSDTNWGSWAEDFPDLPIPAGLADPPLLPAVDEQGIDTLVVRERNTAPVLTEVEHMAPPNDILREPSRPRGLPQPHDDAAPTRVDFKFDPGRGLPVGSVPARVGGDRPALEPTEVALPTESPDPVPQLDPAHLRPLEPITPDAEPIDTVLDDGPISVLERVTALTDIETDTDADQAVLPIETQPPPDDTAAMYPAAAAHTRVAPASLSADPTAPRVWPTGAAGPSLSRPPPPPSRWPLVALLFVVVLLTAALATVAVVTTGRTIPTEWLSPVATPGGPSPSSTR